MVNLVCILLLLGIILWAHKAIAKAKNRQKRIFELINSREQINDSANNIMPQRDRITSKSERRDITHYLMPKGSYLSWAKSIEDPVRWGFLSRKEWEEYKSHYNVKLLDPETRDKLIEWQSEKIRTREYNEKRYKDLQKTRQFIKRTIDFKSKDSVKPYYKSEDVFTRYSSRGLCWYDKKSFWGAQCLALSTISNISVDFSCFYLNKKPNDFLGSPADDLYPIISGADDAYFLYSILYDFGYGPNLFPWHEYRMNEETLEGKHARLYLVEIDIGRIVGSHSYCVYKVGITTKQYIVGSTNNSRFGGHYKKFIRIIRSHLYEDGRVAYMKEQVILNFASITKFKCADKKEFDLKMLSEMDLQTLGLSEWMPLGSTEGFAIKIFERFATRYI